MKKALERRKHSAVAVVKAEPKKFAPPQTPFPGAQDGSVLFCEDVLFLTLIL